MRILIVALNVGFGLYQRNRELTTSAYLLRLVLTFAIAAALAYVIAEALPGGKVFQATLGVAVLLAIGGLLLLRHLIVMPLVGSLLPYRVLVLGTGPEARLVEASLAATHPSGMRIVGFHALEKAQRTLVSRRRIIANTGPLEETVKRLGVNEIIVAVREQRGGVLPLRALLDCRLNGVRVTDLARFFERVHGKVPIELLKVSWLIYGDGYRQGWLRTTVKRGFDVIVARPASAGDLAAHGRHRDPDCARRPWPDHLSADARRPPRQEFHGAQVSQHGAGCGEGGQPARGRA